MINGDKYRETLWLIIRKDKPFLYNVRNELQGVFEACFGENVFDVELDRVLCDTKLIGYIAVGAAADQFSYHCHFAFGKISAFGDPYPYFGGAVRVYRFSVHCPAAQFCKSETVAVLVPKALTAA